MEIMSNLRRLLMSNSSGVIDGYLGDVVFYDSNKGRFIAISINEITSAISGYIPIGVVVVPASHNVYGDHSCGIVSLHNLSCLTPDVGTSDLEFMFWGGGGIDTIIPNYDTVNQIGSNGELSDTVECVSMWGRIPTDNNDLILSSDGVTGYWKVDENSLLPSPYLSDGSRNFLYSTTFYSEFNALSDFRGNWNTNVLLSLSTNEDWRNVAILTNSISVGYYPAACSSWRYHTEGTSCGDWYLPAAGELGYLVNRNGYINTIIERLIELWPDSGFCIVSPKEYISSTEFTADIVRNMHVGTGGIGRYQKDHANCYGRAFLRL